MLPLLSLHRQIHVVFLTLFFVISISPDLCTLCFFFLTTLKWIFSSPSVCLIMSSPRAPPPCPPSTGHLSPPWGATAAANLSLQPLPPHWCGILHVQGKGNVSLPVSVPMSSVNRACHQPPRRPRWSTISVPSCSTHATTSWDKRVAEEMGEGGGGGCEKQISVVYGLLWKEIGKKERMVSAYCRWAVPWVHRDRGKKKLKLSSWCLLNIKFKRVTIQVFFFFVVGIAC